MKVVLINTSEQSGGAAIACKRLMVALQNAGIQAKLIVRDKTTDNPDVITVNTSYVKRKLNFIRFAWERLIIMLNNKFSKTNLFAVSIANSGNNISKHPAVQEADIIHIHWVNQGFLSLKNIRQLIKTGKPIVWTMHDMWAYTGICHHARACDNYKAECKQCPFLQNKSGNDLSTKIFIKKKAIYQIANLVFVGCSKWVTNGAQQSGLLKSLVGNVVSIPNPINCNHYHPIDKSLARKQFNFAVNKKLILFGSAKVTDKRKGIDYLIGACEIIAQNYPDAQNEIEVIAFGQHTDALKQLIPFTVHSMNYISNLSDMVALYNAADVYVTPSLEDNLPNTIMEAMACAIPCVGFNIGGIPEMITHKQNGYIARYKSEEDLANGIRWTLFEADYEQLSQNARQKATELYSEEIVAAQYINLYKKHIQTNNLIS